MRFYAERPLRAVRQLAGDLLVAAWVVGIALLARAAFELVDGLQKPARNLADAGGTVRDAFAGAARAAGGLPLVGSDLARALGRGTAAGTSLASAGSDQITLIGTAALSVGIGLFVLAAVPVLLIWGRARVRYAQEAGSAVAARSFGPDLLALRALTRQPTSALLAVSTAPAMAWRKEDLDVLHALAALELSDLGLRPGQR